MDDKKTNVSWAAIAVPVVNKSNNELPSYTHVGDAGMDIRAYLDGPKTLRPMERALIPTGLFLELPDGYEAQVRPRSGLALKHGITVLNTPGTIDSKYRGEVGVILMNLSEEPFTIYPGDRIAQMVFKKVEKAVLFQVNKLDEANDRGGGFGHSGIA